MFCFVFSTSSFTFYYLVFTKKNTVPQWKNLNKILSASIKENCVRVGIILLHVHCFTLHVDIWPSCWKWINFHYGTYWYEGFEEISSTTRSTTWKVTLLEMSAFNIQSVKVNQAGFFLLEKRRKRMECLINSSFLKRHQTPQNVSLMVWLT